MNSRSWAIFVRGAFLFRVPFFSNSLKNEKRICDIFRSCLSLRMGFFFNETARHEFLVDSNS